MHGGSLLKSFTYLDVTRRTLIGISLSILVLFVVVTAVTADFDPESLFFVGPVIVIPLLTALALRRWYRKTLAVAAVVGLLLIFFNAPYKDIFNPTATLDFIFLSVGTFGGLIVLVSAVMGFIHRNAENLKVMPQGLFLVFAALVVIPSVAAIGGAVAWMVGGDDVDVSVRAASTEVIIDKFDFSPETISGSDMLYVRNDDLFKHAFTVEDLDIDVELNPGRETLVDLSGVAPGSYEVTCSVPGHESMEAILAVN